MSDAIFVTLGDENCIYTVNNLRMEVSMSQRKHSQEFKKEAKRILALALPIMGTQLAQTANGFVDTIMAGQASSTDLAAVALGSSFWLPLYLFTVGLLLATSPTVAQLYGAQQYNEIGSKVRQCLWLALASGCLGWLALQNADGVVSLFKMDAQLQQLSVAYLKAISWGIPAVAAYAVLSSFLEAINKPNAVLITSLMGLLLNIPLNYALIFGKLGFPALGGVGCGWATTGVMWSSLLMLTLYINTHPKLKAFALFKQYEKPNFKILYALTRLGFPIGLAIFFEVSIFSVIALFLARLGNEVVASHQIALNFSSLVFMLPLSIGLALTVTVGQAVGKKDQPLAFLTARIGLTMNILLGIVLAFLMIIGRNFIATWYTSNENIRELAATLLLWAAMFQLSDAIQITSSSILRGFKDTKMPMFLTLFAYWLVGLPIGYTLSFDVWLPGKGAHGFWWGLIIALTTAALLLSLRVRTFLYRAQTH